MDEKAIERLEAGDELRVIVPIRTHDGRRALVVPGDRLWVMEIRGDRMRVRCPEAHYDDWVDTRDPRISTPLRGTS